MLWQVLATIMAIVGAYSAYATDIVAVQRVFYNQNYNFSCKSSFRRPGRYLALLTLSVDQWLLVMSTQLIGFSIGGIARRFLVQPPSMSKSLSAPLYCSQSHPAIQFGRLTWSLVRSSTRCTLRPMPEPVIGVVSPERGSSCTL